MAVGRHARPPGVEPSAASVTTGRHEVRLPALARTSSPWPVATMARERPPAPVARASGWSARPCEISPSAHVRPASAVRTRGEKVNRWLGRTPTRSDGPLAASTRPPLVATAVASTWLDHELVPLGRRNSCQKVLSGWSRRPMGTVAHVPPPAWTEVARGVPKEASPWPASADRLIAAPQEASPRATAAVAATRRATKRRATKRRATKRRATKRRGGAGSIPILVDGGLRVQTGEVLDK